MGESAERTGRSLRWALALLWTVVFLYLLIGLDPGDSSLISMAGSWSQLLGLKPGALMKVGHVFGFFLLVMLWGGALSRGYRKPLPPRAWIGLPLGVLLLAATTEMLQGLNPARHPAWMDVGFNTLGAAIGLGIRLLVVRRAEE